MRMEMSGICTIKRDVCSFFLSRGQLLNVYLAGRYLDAYGGMDTEVFADRAAIFTPVSIPVWPMSRAVFAFMTPLLPATSKLLPIGDFTIHESFPSPPEKAVVAQVKETITCTSVVFPTNYMTLI